MEDDEYKKLPIEDRCVHKLWKARVNGYEEVTKLFRQIDDEKSPEFAKYLGLVKNFVTDSNAVAQEKGLAATLAFFENYANAGKAVGEVMGGIVNKCIGATKVKTKDLALQIILMCIEIERQEIVMEELTKGMDLKNPKIVCGCINSCTIALREFGSKVITVKPLVKKITTLFADRDKGVRDEARALVIEIFRWIGPAIRSQLSNLQQVQITELEVEFAKIEGQKATPTRYLRSQKAKQAKLIVEKAEIEDDDEEEEVDNPTPLDPYDLADPVDILSKLPKDFYENIEAKSWQVRKEALETVENLVKTPKLENGDYGDLVRALKKVIQKDSNILCVALAGKCLTSLASGLKKRFQIYASACVSPLLEKFKEKKQNVVTAIRDAIDAIYLTTNLETILDDVLEALNNKNPSVKSETALFLSRSFTKTQPTILNKKILKAICGALLKIINEPDPTVRDSSCEALGTLMKLVGEKSVSPFLVELEKDAIKMTKIRECCEKAVMAVKLPKTKKDRPSTAPVKSAAPTATVAKTPASSTSKRPTTATKKKAVISSGSATIVKSKGKSKPNVPSERQISDEEAMEVIEQIVNPQMLTSLDDTNWKNRLAAVQAILKSLQSIEITSVPTQAFVRVINKKPGLKDTNFQVLNARLDAVKYLAENCAFSITVADCCLIDVIEKLGDAKNGSKAGETLTAIAEATSLNHVSLQVIDFSLGQKSPKVLQEALMWLSNAIKEFGFSNLNAKAFIESAKKALASSNPAVRTSAIALLGTLYLYMGPALHMFLENEKPALLEQINAEFDKYENEKPPSPIRGISKSPSTNSLDEEIEELAGGDAGIVNVQDLLPRVDISSQITETIINEMSDKNWKVRNEALTKVSSILSEAKFIKPNLGDLTQALALRLVDSNTKIAQTALNICDAIATAMGPPCKQYIRVLFPGFLQGLGDNKAWIRSASISSINAFGDQCGYKEFFESEMVFDALKTGSPTLRSELWNWLADKLPKIKSVPKEELLICIQFLYTNLEDRNADVRKNAQEAVFGFMIHLSYESMVKQTEKLKPGSKIVVMGVLDKVRPNLPVKPLPTKKPKNESKEEKVVKGTKPVANTKNAVKPKAAATNAKQTSARKKDDEIDTSPLLVVNNLKHQRTIDESKLKVLKWNFTTPREEFVDLLKEQMTAANVNKTLMNNMFHSDFRYHIKAIESLMEDLSCNGVALMSNLDLILKWLTLRFFDTNPSVLLKGLEYLHSVFNMLIENKYNMLENEASSFLPYLLLKIGDPKDAVRNGVRSLLKQIWNIYSVSKLFSYIMEGLKSKNARQRAECLEVLGSIINEFDLSVCLPSPTVCLKEVAKQISDRDNSVRNAALNCIVQAYYIVGEKVYKMVGNISDKDMSLLEERIKRASKKPVQPKIAKIEPFTMPIAAVPSPSHSEQLDRNATFAAPSEEEEIEDEDEIPGVVLPSQVRQELEEDINGPFQLDYDLMQQLDKIKISTPEIKLQIFDTDFLNEEIVMPSFSDARAKVMPLSPPKPILPTHSFSRSPLNQRPTNARSGQELLLEKIIDQMASPELTVALKAIEQMQEILQSNKGTLMVEYENNFMAAVTMQLKLLYSQDPRTNMTVSKLYRSILTVIDSFYLNKMLGRKMNAAVTKNIINQLIILLVEGKLEGCPNGDAYVRVINLHCVKIIERSDPTSIICGLINLLYESVQTQSSVRLTDLVMKSLWRVIKIMPPWVEEIDYDNVLLEIHNFMKDFPSTWWKEKPADIPLRTVKTILHSMAKMKGGSLMLHLSKIPNTNDSEMEIYIVRLLKTLKLDEVKQVPLKTDSRRSLSRSTHALLTDIFQKIGNKEETKEGLNLLYDFLQEHPEADIDPFLKRSSQFFQEYIQKNLKEIENNRKLALVEPKEDSAMTSETPVSGKDNKSCQYWRDRLNMWKRLWEEKANFNSTD